jgi:hypothetical protein
VRARIGIFVAFALILRSLLAPGLMLEFGNEPGTFSVVICTEHGAVSVDLDANGLPLHKKTDKGSNLNCPYSASSLVALLSAPIALPASAHALIQSGAPLRSVAQYSRHELPDPARGPPIA